MVFVLYILEAFRNYFVHACFTITITYQGHVVVVLLVMETIPRLRVEQKLHSPRSPESCGFDFILRY